MIDFFNDMLAWINSGIYDFVVEAYAWIIIKVTEFKLGFLITMMEFSWDVGKEILTQLNVSEAVTNALSALPAETVAKLNFFNVINGLNLILNAVVTRFVMKFSMGVF